MTTAGARRDPDGRWVFESVVESVQWGRARYTLIRVPAGLADDARARGTRRVAALVHDLITSTH
ncbi:MAG: hypothetical protein ACRCSN_19400 [Dermatophilaceae bacterium]